MVSAKVAETRFCAVMGIVSCEVVAGTPAPEWCRLGTRKTNGVPERVSGRNRWIRSAEPTAVQELYCTWCSPPAASLTLRRVIETLGRVSDTLPSVVETLASVTETTGRIFRDTPECDGSTRDRLRDVQEHAKDAP